MPSRDSVEEAEPPVSLQSLPDDAGGEVGVFATRDIPAGGLALPFPGTLAATPDVYSIQVDAHTHLRGAGTTADELRHACEPNARVVVEGAPPALVVALRNISAGEEITIDYCATEDAMLRPFSCRCGSPVCYGEVRGYRFLDDEQKARLADVASDWLVDRRSAPRR